MKKGWLTLFTIICLATTVYTAYLLFNGQVSPTAGSVLLSVGVVLSIWSISLTRKRKYQLGGGTVAAIVIIVALLAGATGAYAGYEPLVGAKEKVSTWMETNTSKAVPIAPPAETNEQYKTSTKATSESSGIIGRWQHKTLVNQFMEFFKDGRLVFDDGQYIITGTYELIGDEYISLYFDGLAGAFASMSLADTWKYYISGDTITIYAAGEKAVLRRVR